MPEPWQEISIDDGYYDIYRVMRTPWKVGFDGCVVPDHIPAMVRGSSAGRGNSCQRQQRLELAGIDLPFSIGCSNLQLICGRSAI